MQRYFDSFIARHGRCPDHIDMWEIFGDDAYRFYRKPLDEIARAELELFMQGINPKIGKTNG